MILLVKVLSKSLSIFKAQNPNLVEKKIWIRGTKGRKGHYRTQLVIPGFNGGAVAGKKQMDLFSIDPIKQNTPDKQGEDYQAKKVPIVINENKHKDKPIAIINTDIVENVESLPDVKTYGSREKMALKILNDGGFFVKMLETDPYTRRDVFRTRLHETNNLVIHGIGENTFIKLRENGLLRQDFSQPGGSTAREVWRINKTKFEKSTKLMIKRGVLN